MAFSRTARKALRLARQSNRKIADPYYQGDSAWHANVNVNPYHEGTENYEDWQLGWNDADHSGISR